MSRARKVSITMIDIIELYNMTQMIFMQIIAVKTSRVTIETLKLRAPE